MPIRYVSTSCLPASAVDEADTIAQVNYYVAVHVDDPVAVCYAKPTSKRVDGTGPRYAG